jgi:hypothetical protein
MSGTGIRHQHRSVPKKNGASTASYPSCADGIEGAKFVTGATEAAAHLRRAGTPVLTGRRVRFGEEG